MTLKEYLKLNKIAFLCIYKVGGIIFTSCLIVMTIILGLTGKDPWIVSKHWYEPSKMFLLCFLCGQGFILFILITAIFAGYFKVKSLYKEFYKIPEAIRTKYDIRIGIQNQNPKYYEWDFFMFSKNYNDFQINYEFKKDEVWITISQPINDQEFKARCKTIILEKKEWKKMTGPEKDFAFNKLSEIFQAEILESQNATNDTMF